MEINLLTMKDLAALCKVSLSTIRKWSAAKKLTAYEVKAGEHFIRYRSDLIMNAVEKGVLFE